LRGHATQRSAGPEPGPGRPAPSGRSTVRVVRPSSSLFCLTLVLLAWSIPRLARPPVASVHPAGPSSLRHQFHMPSPAAPRRRYSAFPLANGSRPMTTRLPHSFPRLFTLSPSLPFPPSAFFSGPVSINPSFFSSPFFPFIVVFLISFPSLPGIAGRESGRFPAACSHSPMWREDVTFRFRFHRNAPGPGSPLPPGWLEVERGPAGCGRQRIMVQMSAGPTLNLSHATKGEGS